MTEYTREQAARWNPSGGWSEDGEPLKKALEAIIAKYDRLTSDAPATRLDDEIEAARELLRGKSDA